MILYEFEGKELLKKAGVAVPKSIVIISNEYEKSPEKILNQVQDDVGIPCVLKAQVLSGKRADVGGIVMIDNDQETSYKIQELFGKTINGEKVEKVLVEEKVEIESEYYLSISYDTERRSPILSLSMEGGTGIEDRKVDKYTINPITRTVDLPHNLTIEPLQALINLFFDQDCLLLEINPLVKVKRHSGAEQSGAIESSEDPIGPSGLQDDNDSWVALDAKIKLDDDARRRHEDWDFPPRSVAGRVPTYNEIAARKIDEDDYRGTAGSAYFDLDGDIAVLSSGGGVSLTAMDALIKAGGKPANFTEYSGNPPKEKCTCHR